MDFAWRNDEAPAGSYCPRGEARGVLSSGEPRRRVCLPRTACSRPTARPRLSMTILVISIVPRPLRDVRDVRVDVRGQAAVAAVLVVAHRAHVHSRVIHMRMCRIFRAIV